MLNDLQQRFASKKLLALILAYVVPALEGVPARWKAIIIAVGTPVYLIAQAAVDHAKASNPPAVVVSGVTTGVSGTAAASGR